MIVTLAWRNIWRNKRRTAITLASIFFAVILSALMMSIKEGVYENMIEGTAGSFNGYAQVHQNGYWDDHSLDYAFEITDTLETKLVEQRGLMGYLPRIESFSLAVGDSITKGAMIIGIDPVKESNLNKLHERVSKGSFLAANDRGILVGKGLADYLGVDIGDTLILLGSGYHGMSAAGKYPVRGIVKFGSPELSKQLVFLALPEAHAFFGTDGLVTTLVLKTATEKEGLALAHKLRNELDKRYEVMDWQEMNPDMVNMIETDRVEGYVFMFILYLVISFGIFGTMLMMLAERKREFGVLMAIGMKRIKLALIVWFEVLTLSILGSFIGIIGAFPISLYLHNNPIRYGEEMTKMAEDYGMEAVLKASIAPGIFLQQALVIAIIASFISIYPFIKLLFARAINQMRS